MAPILTKVSYTPMSAPMLGIRYLGMWVVDNITSVSYGNGGGPNSFIRIRKESGGIPQYFYSMRIYAVKANATIHLSGTNRGIIAPDGKFYADKTLRSMGERDFRSALGITEN